MPAPPEPPTPPSSPARAKRAGILGRPWVLTPVLVLLVTLVGAVWVLSRDLDYVAPFGRMPERVELDDPQLQVGTVTVRGVVRSPRGNPLAGASVTAVVAGRPVWTYTDAEGAFELDELMLGELELAVLARGYRPRTQGIEVRDDGKPLEVRLEEAIPQPPDVAEHPTTDLVGLLVGWRPGSPTEGYELLVEPLDSPTRVGVDVPRRATIDAGGRFTVPDLIHGRYRLAVLPPSARGGTWPDLLRAWADPPVVKEHTGTEDLLLSVVAGRLVGVARDDGGEPLPGALVRVRPLDPGSPGLPLPSVRCGDDGAWAVDDLPPGLYEVQLTGGAVRRRVEVRVGAREELEPDL